jgi:uncharacterized protein (TIGR02757 family)
LERVYGRYGRRKFVPPDPLQFVYKYRTLRDREVVGLLSAALAYGRVRQIEKSLDNLLSRMGQSPYAFVYSFGTTERRRLADFRHRFTTGRDIADLVGVLRQVFDRWGSLEHCFLLGYDESHSNIVPALSRFCDSLLALHAQANDGRVTPGLKYLLAGPAAGSACKRMNLFLRWMVRKDEVDPGLWSSIDKAKLIVPVDVHMARLCRILRLYERRTLSLAAAVEITEAFRQLEPADPVKYDFALSRIGIVDNCDGNYKAACVNCELFEICRPS